MRKVGMGLLAISLAGHAASAEELLQCLTPDVLHGLVRTGMVGVGDAAVTDEEPADMTGIDRPEELTFIAASVSGSNVTAAFRTALPNDVALERALDGLEASGWQTQGNERSNVYYDATPTSPIPSLMGAVCKEGRMLSVGSRDVEGTTYLNYHFAGVSPTSACGGDSAALAARPTIGGNSLDRYMPALSFPTDPATGRPAAAQGGGSGGSMQSRYSSTQVAIATPIGELAAFLASQLSQAGWASDSAWTGTLTAGSTWLRQPDAETELMAVLDVAAQSPASYAVTFRIVSLN